MIKFTVPGEPVAKGRPRFSTRGGYARAYTPKKTRDAEQIIACEAVKACPAPLLGSLVLTINIYRSIPKSFTKAKTAEALAGKLHPVTRPDLDNYIKIVLDALNGVAYHDDSSVVYIVAGKWYSDNPRMEIRIAEVSP